MVLVHTVSLVVFVLKLLSHVFFQFKFWICCIQYNLSISPCKLIQGPEPEVDMPLQMRSPLATPTKSERKLPLDPVYCTTSTAYFSPKLNLHSKYGSYLFGPTGEEEEEEEEESVGSISDTSPESTGESEEEIVSSESHGSSLCSVNGPVSIPINEPVYMRVGGLVRGKSKENLWLDVTGVRVNVVLLFSC